MIKIHFMPSDTTINFLNHLSNQKWHSPIYILWFNANLHMAILLSFSTWYVHMDGRCENDGIEMEQIWKACHRSQPLFGVEPSVSANYVNFKLFNTNYIAVNLSYSCTHNGLYNILIVGVCCNPQNLSTLSMQVYDSVWLGMPMIISHSTSYNIEELRGIPYKYWIYPLLLINMRMLCFGSCRKFLGPYVHRYAWIWVYISVLVHFTSQHPTLSSTHLQ